MSLASFNQSGNLQAITASSPERLAELIRSITVPIKVMGFTATPGLHTCYFRCNHRIAVKNRKVQQGGMNSV